MRGSACHTFRQRTEQVLVVCQGRAVRIGGAGATVFLNMDATIYDVPVDAAAPNNVHAMALALVGFNKRVLEVGCAAGHMTRAFASQSNTVVGIEIDAVAAERAALTAERVVIADLDVTDLADAVDNPRGDDRFDVVTFGDVLEHLRNPLAVLRSARAVLKAEGFVVISVPNVAHADVRLALVEGRWEYRQFGLMDCTHIRFFTRESLRRLVREAGFHVTDVDRVLRPAFGTEIGVLRESFPPDVVDKILMDPDAETYQFVLKAVLDDGNQARAEAFDRLATLEDERLHVPVQLALAEAERTLLAGRIGQLEGECAAAREQVQQLQGAQQSIQPMVPAGSVVVSADVVEELRAQGARLAEIRSHPVFRAINPVRRLLRRVRSL